MSKAHRRQQLHHEQASIPPEVAPAQGRFHLGVGNKNNKNAKLHVALPAKAPY